MYLFLCFFIVTNYYKLLKIGVQGNGWYFFAWDLKVLSQSAAKHTTSISDENQFHEIPKH